MRLSYGLAISAALITGGTAIYYVGHPRTVVTAPDLVELMEGINERKAAIASLPFTGDPTNGWSFTEYSTQNLVLAHATMKSIMDETRDLIPSFVDTYTNDSVTMHTVTGLFDRLNIGDGTNLFTVSVETNGTRHYSDAPTLTLYTGTLWECFAILQALTVTARNAEWLAGTNYAYATSSVSRTLYSADVLKVDPAPAEFTNINLTTDGQTINTLQPVYDILPFYTNVGAAAAQPFEKFRMQGGLYASTVRGSVIGHPELYSYVVIAQTRFGSATRRDSTGGVYIANLSMSVAYSASIAWAATGGYFRVSTNFGTYPTSVVFGVTGLTAQAGTCSGVSTDKVFLAVAPTHTNLESFASAGFDWFDVAYGWWDEPSSHIGDTVLNTPYDITQDIYGPEIRAWMGVYFPRPAVIHWTFESCRP